MSQFINFDQAWEFANSLQDPVVRRVIENSYATILTSRFSPDGKFDLLYYFRQLELLLRNRKSLGKFLSSDMTEEEMDEFNVIEPPRKQSLPPDESIRKAS